MDDDPNKILALYPRSEQQWEVKTESLRGVAESFSVSVGRVNGLFYMPILLVAKTRIVTLAYNTAEYEGAHLGEDERTAAFRETLEASMTDLQNSPADFADMCKTTIVSMQGYVGGDSQPYVIQPWLASLVIGAWTAIETLAGDLWEAAVNSHPHGLAGLAGKPGPGDAHRLKEPAEPNALADDPATKKGDVGKLMRVDYLEQYGFNVSAMMGTIWKRERFNGFQTLRHIQDAYVQAFHTDHADIRAAVLDPSLRQLAVVRNLLVHRGGIVDEKYLRDAKQFPRLVGATAQQPLVLDGDLVRDLIDPAIEKAIALIGAVDMWLQSHP